MDVRTHEDVAAAAAAHGELGHEYDGALAEGLIERISSEIDKQVDARLAQRGIQPSRAPWTNVAMGLGSVGLGIGATADATFLVQHRHRTQGSNRSRPIPCICDV